MSSPPLAKHAQDLPPTIFAGLAERIASYKGELIPLHIGDTCLAPPVDPSCFDLGDPSLYRYGKIAGWEELISEIERSLRRHPDLAYVKAGVNIQLSAGATHAICSAARATLEPGDEVILPTPYWPLATGMIAVCGAKPVEVPLTRALYENPDADVRELLAPALSKRTRAIYLITPNNPDGKVLSRRHLEQIAELAVERNLWVISDEVYQDYVYDGVHTPVASLPGMADRTLTAFSFSKSHGLAGLRIGFLVGPARAIAAVRAIHFHTIYSVPLLVQKMALSALQSGDVWLDAARAHYRGARDGVCAALTAAGLSHSVPEGGSYVFVDFAETLGKRPLVDLLGRAIDRGVLIAPGIAFGAAHASEARICFTGAPRDRVLEGVARLAEVARELQKE